MIYQPMLSAVEYTVSRIVKMIDNLNKPEYFEHLTDQEREQIGEIVRKEVARDTNRR